MMVIAEARLHWLTMTSSSKGSGHGMAGRSRPAAQEVSGRDRSFDGAGRAAGRRPGDTALVRGGAARSYADSGASRKRRGSPGRASVVCERT